MNDYFHKSKDIDDWHMMRWGRFTASENWKLICGGKNGAFGEGANTYIEAKAIQMTIRYWERPELEGVKAMLHGKMYEYPAYKRYVQTTGNDVSYFGEETPLFLDYEPLVDEVGGSPDVGHITNEGTIDIGAEIKCPKDPAYHFRRLFWKDQFDIKVNYLQAYTQIQNLLMITGARQWDFISFDERQRLFDKQIKIIEVKPDKIFQNNLHVRLKMAIADKYKLISLAYGKNISNRKEFQEQIRA